MMSKLIARAEAIARAAQRHQLERITGTLRAIRGGALSNEDTAVVVRGRGLIRRWLNDAELRFLGGGIR